MRAERASNVVAGVWGVREDDDALSSSACRHANCRAAMRRARQTSFHSAFDAVQPPQAELSEPQYMLDPTMALWRLALTLTLIPSTRDGAQLDRAHLVRQMHHLQEQLRQVQQMEGSEVADNDMHP